MTRLARLGQLEQDRGHPVRVALIGAGQMGSGLAAQIGRIPGLHLSVVADVDLDRASSAAARAGADTVVDDPAGVARAVRDGATGVVDDAAAVSELPVDVVVEATGVPNVGAGVVSRAIDAGQHVVVLNVETDVTVGHLLARRAAAAGVVYSVADGDEPTCARELYDFAQELAFDVVCAGKGKNNPYVPTSTPDTAADEAARKHMNPKMLASFQDGSKTMIEMAALSNSLGLPVDVTGMHGVTANVDALATTLVPTADGGVLSGAGRVDFAFGPAPGVFVVVRSDDPTVAEEMTYLSMGPGPYFTLYRPFHLASIEAPRTVITAMLDGESAITANTWTSEVVATAKFDLPAGTSIDGIGGFHVRGVTWRADEAADLLPLGLAQHAVLQRPVPAGEPIPRDAVEIADTHIADLRRQQDEALAGGA